MGDLILNHLYWTFQIGSIAVTPLGEDNKSLQEFMSQFQMYDKRSKRSEDPMYYYADEFDEMLNENPDYHQKVDFGQK